MSAFLKNESKPQTALANNSRPVCPSSTYSFLVPSLSSSVLASLAQVNQNRETEREKERERERGGTWSPSKSQFVMVEWRIIVTLESGAPPRRTIDTAQWTFFYILPTGRPTIVRLVVFSQKHGGNLQELRGVGMRSDSARSQSFHPRYKL